MPSIPVEQSVLWRRAIEHWVSRDSTSVTLAKEISINIATARRYCRTAHKKKLLHIVSWVTYCEYGNGPKIPVYRYGAGRDVPRPLPLSETERKRIARENPLRTLERLLRKRYCSRPGM